MHTVLDLFSAAAGGWSLGMHLAGFRTVAACEAVEWRRILYSENNPDVRLYHDVCTLTAERLLADLGALPDIVVGSPPCTEISSANTAGAGVDGEHSRLFFEAVRIAIEIRELARSRGTGGARWIALENSAQLRTKGADRVLAALEAGGYTCWSFVVRAGHGRGGAGIGANHERPRVWIVGCDLTQPADPAQIGHAGRGAWGRGPAWDGQASAGEGLDGDAAQDGRPARRSRRRAAADAGLQEHAYVCLAGSCDDRLDASGERPQWNGGLAHHLRVDDGLSAWVAGTRVAVGGPRGTAAASLLVEAFGDAVLPQIPEAIGRAILRVEAALGEIYGRAAA